MNLHDYFDNTQGRGVLATSDSKGVVDVAMVGHTIVNRVLLCAVLGLGNDSFWRIGQDTCAVNVFSVGDDGLKTLTLLNDTSHLRALAQPSAGGNREQQRDRAPASRG